MTTSGRFPIHHECGGRGCAECSGTGYARMGPAAIAALDARLGRAPEAPGAPVPEPGPAGFVVADVSPATTQLAFAWGPSP